MYGRRGGTPGRPVSAAESVYAPPRSILTAPPRASPTPSAQPFVPGGASSRFTTPTRPSTSARPFVGRTPTMSSYSPSSEPLPAAPGPTSTSMTMDQLYGLVLDISDIDKRETALFTLSKYREDFPDLAPILWHSVGTIAALLHEIVSIYPLLHSLDTLTTKESNRCCNALALLQCVASHPDTRGLFLKAYISLFLYPFLNAPHSSRPFDFLRLTSLGVIGALVKNEDREVIVLLLETNIVPLCLKIMETGNELLRTVATFVIQKILQDDAGLEYVCATRERFFAVSGVLNMMVEILKKQPSNRLLRHIINCYHRLAQDPKYFLLSRICLMFLSAKEAMRKTFPVAFLDDTFNEHFDDDVSIRALVNDLRDTFGRK